MQGGVAERLCSGLQIRLGRFDSDPRLQGAFLIHPRMMAELLLRSSAADRPQSIEGAVCDLASSGADQATRGASWRDVATHPHEPERPIPPGRAKKAWAHARSVPFERFAITTSVSDAENKASRTPGLQILVYTHCSAATDDADARHVKVFDAVRGAQQPSCRFCASSVHRPYTGRVAVPSGPVCKGSCTTCRQGDPRQSPFDRRA